MSDSSPSDPLCSSPIKLLAGGVSVEVYLYRQDDAPPTIIVNTGASLVYGPAEFAILVNGERVAGPEISAEPIPQPDVRCACDDSDVYDGYAECSVHPAPTA